MGTMGTAAEIFPRHGDVGESRKETNPTNVHSEGMERRRDDTEMENFYHACLYDLLQNPEHRVGRAAKLNSLKAKLVKQCSARLACGTIEMQAPDMFLERTDILIPSYQKANTA